MLYIAMRFVNYRMQNEKIKPEEIIQKLEEIKLWVEKLEADKDGRSKLSNPPISKH